MTSKFQTIKNFRLRLQVKIPEILPRILVDILVSPWKQFKPLLEETVKDVLNIYRYLQTINAGKGVEKRELSYSVGGNAN